MHMRVLIKAGRATECIGEGGGAWGQTLLPGLRRSVQRTVRRCSEAGDGQRLAIWSSHMWYSYLCDACRRAPTARQHECHRWHAVMPGSTGMGRLCMDEDRSRSGGSRGPASAASRPLPGVSKVRRAAASPAECPELGCSQRGRGPLPKCVAQCSLCFRCTFPPIEDDGGGNECAQTNIAQAQTHIVHSTRTYVRMLSRAHTHKPTHPATHPSMPTPTSTSMSTPHPRPTPYPHTHTPRQKGKHARMCACMRVPVCAACCVCMCVCARNQTRFAWVQDGNGDVVEHVLFSLGLNVGN